MVDIDDTIIEVHGRSKQGSGYGYSGVRGLNALIATATTAQAAPVILAQRLRKGACGSPRGAARIVGDALATLRTMRGPAATGRILLRADSAFHWHPAISAAIRADADVSVCPPRPESQGGHRQSPMTWTTIEYPTLFSMRTPAAGSLVLRSPRSALRHSAPKKRSEHVPGRLIVRRLPDVNAKHGEGQGTLFDT